MIKVSGGSGVKLLECTNPRRNKYKVRWNVTEIKDEDGNVTGAEFMEEDFDHMPELSEIKSLIIDWYNTQTTEKIKSGFTYQDAAVWLSNENQFNYKVAYDNAVQTNGTSLPVKFKFGTDDAPVYKQFNTVKELKAFHVAWTTYISTLLAAAWSEKDKIDWTQYETTLPTK